jgi:hypothetical protein
MHNLFIELLQVSLGTREKLSMVPLPDEWNAVYDEAERQAVEGIMLAGLEHLPENQRPPQDILLQWIGVCQQIEVKNVLTSKTCHKLCKILCEDGFLACVLKGQSNYRYYPKEMKNRRSCGDIDVWVTPKDRGCKHPVRTVLDYIKVNFDMDGLCWLHTSHIGTNDVPVEVHFRPSFMSEPFHNRRFQNYFSNIEVCREKAEIDGKSIPVMKVDEDVIYQMNHIYRHLIDEGVGLRQVVDYFYLLTVWNKEHKRSKAETMKIVSWLGMKKFAGALMYVLREVCGMRESLLLCPVSVKDGQFLMSEILLSGNFGHGDPRVGASGSEGSYLTRRVGQALRRFKRNIRFFTSYPGEVIWEPIVRVEHFVWKKLKLWRF